jgi:RNA polymerase sigma-32 factor
MRGGVTRAYLKTAYANPILSASEELALTRRWRESKDHRALDILITRHLRLAISIAAQFSGYRLPMEDLVSQGHVGLLKAANHFDPEHGARFASYAAVWIKAEIQEYVVRSWSLVDVASTRSRKKLFFKLRKLKRELGLTAETEMAPEHVARIAGVLGVAEADVLDMHYRLAAPDESLNEAAGPHGEGERLERLVDAADNQETILLRKSNLDHQRRLLAHAMTELTDRERCIFAERRLKEEQPTVRSLSQRYGISPERVSQIEARAFRKIRTAVLDADVRHSV